MIDYEYNHLKQDVDALLKHVGAARATDDPQERKVALFHAGLRLIRLEQEIARMGDVIAEMENKEDATP